MPNLEAILLIQLQSHVILKVNIISLNFCWTVPSLGDEYSPPMSPCSQMTGLLWNQPVLIARLKESILWNQKPLCDFPCFCYVLWVIHLPTAHDISWFFLIHLVTSGESGLSTLTCHAITHAVPIKPPPSYKCASLQPAIDDDTLEYSMTSVD